MKIRTGIFGGSFNPIHLGHTKIAETLTALRAVDELWLMVSPLNPFKTENRALLPDEARLQLAHLAVEQNKTIKVSDFEMGLPRPSFMVNTLSSLRNKYPDREFLLIIGADNWLRFPQWHNAEQILSHHRIIIYPRTGYEVQVSQLPKGVTLAHTPLINISSTDIRMHIAQNNYQGEGLPPSVWQEINKKGYYR